MADAHGARSGSVYVRLCAGCVDTATNAGVPAVQPQRIDSDTDAFDERACPQCRRHPLIIGDLRRQDVCPDLDQIDTAVAPLLESDTRMYALEELRGCGNFGSVFRARCSVLGLRGKPVAVKKLKNSSNSSSRHSLWTAEKEVLFRLLRLRFYGVPALLDFSKEHSALVMTYISGTSISEWFEMKAAFYRSEVIAFLSQASLILGFFQKRWKIVHRDIHCGNVLASTPGGRNMQFMLCDLGLAADMYMNDHECKEKQLQCKGTLCPQNGSRSFDPQFDVFCVALVAISMLLGKVIEVNMDSDEAESHRRALEAGSEPFSKIDSNLREILSQCMKRPGEPAADRIKDAVDLWAAMNMREMFKEDIDYFRQGFLQGESVAVQAQVEVLERELRSEFCMRRRSQTREFTASSSVAISQLSGLTSQYQTMSSLSQHPTAVYVSQPGAAADVDFEYEQIIVRHQTPRHQLDVQQLVEAICNFAALRVPARISGLGATLSLMASIVVRSIRSGSTIVELDFPKVLAEAMFQSVANWHNGELDINLALHVRELGIVEISGSNRPTFRLPDIDSNAEVVCSFAWGGDSLVLSRFRAGGDADPAVKALGYSETVQRGQLIVEAGKGGVPAQLTSDDLIVLAKIIEANPQLSTIELKLAGPAPAPFQHARDHHSKSDFEKEFCDALVLLGRAVGGSNRTALCLGRTSMGKSINLDMPSSTAAWNRFLKEALAFSATPQSSLRIFTLCNFRLDHDGAAAVISAISNADGLEVVSITNIELPIPDRRTRERTDRDSFKELFSIADIEFPIATSDRRGHSDSFDELFAALSSRPAIHTLAMSRVTAGWHTSDTEALAIQARRLVDGICSILQGVCGTLRELTLQEMSFAQQGNSKQVAEAIGRCESLQGLELRQIILAPREEDLTTNFLTEAWDDFLDPISNLPALKRLSLEQIEFKFEHIDMLASCMQHRMPALRELRLEQCFQDTHSANVFVLCNAAALRCVGLPSGETFTLAINFNSMNSHTPRQYG